MFSAPEPYEITLANGTTFPVNVIVIIDPQWSAGLTLNGIPTSTIEIIVGDPDYLLNISTN